jgi:glycosyltransferase involved in cell wall biosynthesis
VWNKDSWEAVLLRWHELRVAKRASFIFTATQSMITDLVIKGISPDVPLRVPSCVDTQHFKFSSESREKIRKQYAIPDDAPVLAYLGKFGGMYMEDEAFEFFKVCQDVLDAWIFVLSPDPEEKIIQLSKKHQLRIETMVIKFLEREEIPGYLSTADIGFVAVRQWPSKRYCSPIKTGEYLSCGLPVIVPLGVSDDVAIMTQLGVCIPMTTLDSKSYAAVVDEWRDRFNQDNTESIRRAARNYAESDRSVGRYRKIYAAVFDRL